MKEPVFKIFVEESQLPLEREKELEREIMAEKYRLARAIKAGKSEFKGSSESTPLTSTHTHDSIAEEQATKDNNKNDGSNNNNKNSLSSSKEKDKHEQGALQDAELNAALLLESKMQDEFFVPMLANYILLFFKLYEPERLSLRYKYTPLLEITFLPIYLSFFSL